MSVNALGSSSSASIIDLFRQRRAAMREMEDAVRSGDIGTAQKNLAALGQDSSAGQGSSASAGDGGAQSFRSVMKADLSSLEEAVQKGDLTSAQSALQTLDEDRASMSSPPPPPDAGDRGTGSSGFLSDLKSLIEAAQSGDSSGKQSALAALQWDMQTLLGKDGTATSDSTTSTGQPSFADDLKSFLDAAKSNDTKGMQEAAKKVAADIENAVSSLEDGTKQASGHHGHHHHAPPPASATDAAGTASVSSSDGSGGNQEQAVSASLRNARAAYELLMSFGEAGTA